MIKLSVGINYQSAGSETVRFDGWHADIAKDILDLLQCDYISTGSNYGQNQIVAFHFSDPLETNLQILAPKKGKYSVHLKINLYNSNAAPSWPTQWVAKLNDQPADDISITNISGTKTIWARFDDFSLSEKLNSATLYIDPNSTGTNDTTFPIRVLGNTAVSAYGQNGAVDKIDEYYIDPNLDYSAPVFPWLSDFEED